MHRHHPKTALMPLLAVMLFFLAACSTNKDAPPPACPKASFLEGTSTLTRFRDGPGRDLIDVDFTGNLEGLNGSCQYNIDSDTGAGVLNMDVQINVRADRGPANRDHIAKFNYFVSILDANGKILNKKIFPFSVRFDGNKTIVQDTDAPVTMAIPITAKQGHQDFSIYAGFQLSPEEIRYNRKKNRPGNY